jgi:hypothetical protein
MRGYDRQWHRNDIKAELGELRLAEGRLSRVSELSDVLYTSSRAAHNGFETHVMRFFRQRPWLLGALALYMIPKYSSRWILYRAAAYPSKINEVRNPWKDIKLYEIAEKGNIDKERFVIRCRKLRRVWPLLP